MATEEEAVTLKQFKVWAGKQGGGGGSSKAVTLWEGDGSPGTVDAGRQYRWVVVWLGSDAKYAEPYAVEWGTNKIYAVPQMGREVNGASISYSGTKLTITTDRYVTATKVQVADWE